MTTRLSFAEKKPPSKLAHAAKGLPLDAALAAAHREISSSTDDNPGLDAASSGMESAQAAYRFGHVLHFARLDSPYRAVRHAEASADRANFRALVKEAQIRNPQLSSNPYSRWQQRRAIRKEYAAAKAGRAGTTTIHASELTTRAAEKAAIKSQKTASFVQSHKKGLMIVGIFFVLLALLSNALSSCSVISQSSLVGLAITTYPSEDSDMLAAESQYLAMERELQEKMDRYEETHNYDEYHFKLDEIGHDPYVLISLLTAFRCEAWTIGEVHSLLQTLFEKQYILTETVTKETRHNSGGATVDGRTDDPEEVPDETDAGMQQEDTAYDYTICTVTLENFDLSHLPVYVLSPSQLSLYAAYMATLGNRPDLFAGSVYVDKYYNTHYEKYEIPAEALEDEQFAAMIAEAEKYLGYPYVWGGSSPSTSFDCSGFVCWVLNHCGVGWDVGRLSAKELHGICAGISPGNARPGDLIFFEGTYETNGASHVGIYVGNGRMLHCGDPIQYTSIHTNYWQQHFLSYGRLPSP